MKTIKLKRKYLLLIVLSISIVGISTTAYSDELHNAYSKYIPIEFRRLINHDETANIHDEARRLHHILTHNEFQFYKLVQYTSGTKGYQVHSIKGYEGQRIYQEFLGYANDYDILNDYPEYYFDVMLAQWFSGDGETTKYMMQSIELDSLSNIYQDYYHLINIAIGLAYYDMETIHLSMDSIEDSKYDYTLQSIKRFMYYAYGVGEEVNTSLVGPPFLRSNYYMDHFNHINDYTRTIKRHHKTTKKTFDNKVKGRITIGDKPLEGVFAFISDSMGYSPTLPFYNTFQITNKDGEYTLLDYECVDDSVDQDSISKFTESHTIGYAIPYQLVADKQVNYPEFMNEKDFIQNVNKELPFDVFIENTLSITNAYIDGDEIILEIDEPMIGYQGKYMIEARRKDHKLLNSSTWANCTRIEDGKIAVSMSSLRSHANLEYSVFRDGKTFDIDYFIPPFYLNEELVLYVSRENSIHRTIQNSSFGSNGYILEVPGEPDINTGDKILSKNRPEDAIAWYREHPSLHNLQVLFDLHYYGYKPVKSDNYWFKDDPDYDKALVYLLDLIELDGLNTYTLSTLKECLGKLNRQDEFEPLVSELLSESPKSENLLWIMKHYGLTDDYHKSLSLLDEYMGVIDHKSTHLFQPFYYLIGKSYSATSELSNLYETLPKEDMEPLFDIIENGGVRQGLKWLNRQPESDSKLMFTLLILDLYPHEFPEYAQTRGQTNYWYSIPHYYVDQVENINDQEIKQFLIKYKQHTDWFH